jgi:predicted secreted Zn-dependent protease
MGSALLHVSASSRRELPNKGMKLTKPGELRSFAAYPQCWADVVEGEMKGLVAAAVLLMPLAVGADESPIVKIEEKYYDVTGTTEKELQAAVKKLGPQGRYTGYTEWQVVWAFQAERTESGCSVSAVTTKVDATITLPRWVNSSEGAYDLRLWWNLSVRDLRRHEQIHVDNAIATAKAIEQAVQQLAPATDCPTLEADVARTANAVVEEGRRKDGSYDIRSVHGIASQSPP